MCAYKVGEHTCRNPFMIAHTLQLVTVYFKWWGLQNKVEKAIHKTYPRLFVKLNR